MKAYSQDLRDRAIASFNFGYKRKQIVSMLDIHYETIKDWIRKYKKTGDYSSKQHLNKGVERKFTDKKAVLLYLENNPNALALEMRDSLAPNLPISTFKDALSWMQITYKKRDRLYTKR
jgi:isfu1 transposase